MHEGVSLKLKKCKGLIPWTIQSLQSLYVRLLLNATSMKFDNKLDNRPRKN